MSSEKPMLRQIEWGVENGPTSENAVLSLSTLFFWKFSFSIITCNKGSIRSTNYTNVQIHTSESTGVLYEGVFSLRVSLKLILLQPLEIISIRKGHVLWKQFCCSCMHIKITRNKSQLSKETTWVAKLLRCWSVCKCNDMQTWFSVVCWHIPPRF